MMKLKAIWFAVLSATVFFPGMPSRAENPVKASPDKFSLAVECVKRSKSSLLKKLESGDRNIYKEYVSFRCYKGKVVPSIERRRKVEFMLLFEE